jgi:hypothetical protein
MICKPIFQLGYNTFFKYASPSSRFKLSEYTNIMRKILKLIFM